MTEIKNFEELISSTLKPGQKLVSYEQKNLLPPGENYGSVLLQLILKIQNGDGKEEIISCVAKTCPPRGIIWEWFNTKVTFKTEINFYKVLLEEFKSFCRAIGVEDVLNCFGRCLGARLSLNAESDEIDEDAVIVFENLKVQGFEMGDRFVGFNEASAKIILKDLAAMHAVPIAYRMSKPDEFRDKIQPHIAKYYDLQFSDTLLDGVKKVLRNDLSADSKYVPYLGKIDQAWENLKKYTPHPTRNTMYTTLVHNDFWLNNTMLKFQNGVAVENKLVDFQLINYSSLANDVIFFLYTSVELSVLENKFEDLLKFYYNSFIQVLTKLGCDVNAYTFKGMMDEFALITKQVQFAHILMMMLPIYILKEKASEMSEMDETAFIKESSEKHENFETRLKFVVLDLIRRAWV
ncbi:hypothetical protein MML48_1g10945 [Holotrichia oblita]|uniref:Uncharacterized protein n=1 Tax=Holotrichia oblita TaxID=644536 RepID=A0ACB9TUC8_HOLOL|nr:hypothetical protein MML48_1g10945 [Holotrichia oblita]